MIVKGNLVADADAGTVNRTQDVSNSESSVDNPPPYSSSSDAPNRNRSVSVASDASSSTATATNDSIVPPPSAKRCNFLSVERDNFSIKGSYLVDPNIKPPLDALPQLAVDQSEADRPNLSLYSQNMPVKVDVWIAESKRMDEGTESGRSTGKQRVIVEAKSMNAPVRVRLKTYLPSQPVKVTVTSMNAPATVVIPPNYVGALKISSMVGWITISEKVKGRMTIFSESKGTRNCFIGNVIEAGYGNGEWTGSIIHVETMHCRARILYAEEAEEFNKSKNPFVRWIYGA